MVTSSVPQHSRIRDSFCSLLHQQRQALFFTTYASAMAFVPHCINSDELCFLLLKLSFVTAHASAKDFVRYRINSTKSCSSLLLLFRFSPPQLRQFLFFIAVPFSFVTASTAPILVLYRSCFFVRHRLNSAKSCSSSCFFVRHRLNSAKSCSSSCTIHRIRKPLNILADQSRAG